MSNAAAVTAMADVEAALSKAEAPATEADIAATVTRIYGGGR